MIAGIDYSTRAVDVVLLDEDSDAATWLRIPLFGQDAFERVRSVRQGMRSSMWDDALAIGIEDPRGYNAGALYRIQGAILSCIPNAILVQPFIPSQWRKTVGLPGNASKAQAADFVQSVKYPAAYTLEWPQDACDAYCIALATRTLIQKVAA
jgi:hypothetical protein